MEKQSGIYARYSPGRDRDQTSTIEAQVAMCLEKVQCEGIVWNREFRNGGLLLIEPGNRWENKDIVAWVDGEVTCKRLQLNHSPALLVPDNHDYKVIQVSDDTLILGRVVGRYEAFINGWKPQKTGSLKS